MKSTEFIQQGVQIDCTISQMTNPSKWLPLYRALKLNGYVKEIRPQISKLIRESDPADNVHLSTLCDFYAVQSEYENILAECYPGTVLQGQDMLKKVANMVGLQLPKTVAN